MELKSSRPTYAIVLVVISGFFLCTTFFPFLYSLVSPNEDLQGLLSALEGNEPPTPESDRVVQHTATAVGTLKNAIKVGYAYQVMTKIHYAPPVTSEKMKVSQDVYIAWFENHPEPMLMGLTCYAREDGQKAYQISEVSPLRLIGGYGVALCFFGVSLFLARRRQSPAFAR